MYDGRSETEMAVRITWVTRDDVSWCVQRGHAGTNNDDDELCWKRGDEYMAAYCGCKAR